MTDKIDFTTAHPRLANGRKKVYYYTKSGTKFFDNMDHQLAPPFPEAFVSAYRAAIESEIRSHYKPCGDLDRFLTDYLGDADTLLPDEEREPHPGCAKFQGHAPETQRSYLGFAPALRERFGAASIPVIEDRRFRGDIIAWHEGEAKTSSRSADSKLTVLSNALDYAKRRGLLLHNPAAEIDHLYQAPADKSPWTREEQALLLNDCPQEVADIYWLAHYTGLRRTDLAGVTWEAVQSNNIIWETSKSRRKRTVIVPLVPDAQKFLSDLKRRQMASKHGLQRTLLIGQRGRSLTPNTVGGKVNTRAKELGIARTLHNCRNGFATELVLADFKDNEIAGIMGWTLDDVRELKRIYVHRDKIVSAQVARLERRKD